MSRSTSKPSRYFKINNKSNKFKNSRIMLTQKLQIIMLNKTLMAIQKAKIQSKLKTHKSKMNKSKVKQNKSVIMMIMLIK